MPTTIPTPTGQPRFLSRLSMPTAATCPHHRCHPHTARLARVLRVLLLLLHLLLDTRLLLGLRNDFDLILQTMYVFSDPGRRGKFFFTPGVFRFSSLLLVSHANDIRPPDVPYSAFDYIFTGILRVHCYIQFGYVSFPLSSSSLPAFFIVFLSLLFSTALSCCSSLFSKRKYPCSKT